MIHHLFTFFNYSLFFKLKKCFAVWYFFSDFVFSVFNKVLLIHCFPIILVPEGPPQNCLTGNITGRSFAISWDPPTEVTGKFSYRVELYGPSGKS